MVTKSSGVKSLAVFIDFENLALGFHGRNDRFEIKHVLTRLLEKGKIVAKKAYADWHRFSFYTSSLHEAAIELVEIPRRAQTGKNSADIRLCVDAMDLAYSKEHIDTFVIVSGDSDFSPLVSKLKELGKHVIGLGMTNSTSNLLRDNCDEFIYYEDLTQTAIPEFAFKPEITDAKRKAFLLLAHAYHALRRDNRELIHSSTLKETMRRMKPSFNENYHGYRTFSQLLEDAQRDGLLSLATDAKSGTYVVTNMNIAVSETSNAPKVASPPHQEASPAPHKEDHRDNHHHQRSSHRRFNNRRPHQPYQRAAGAESDKTPSSLENSGSPPQSPGLPLPQGPATQEFPERPFRPQTENHEKSGQPSFSASPVPSGERDAAERHSHQEQDSKTTRHSPEAASPSPHTPKHPTSLSSPEPHDASQEPLAAEPASPETTPSKESGQGKSQRPWRPRNPRGQNSSRTPRSRKPAQKSEEHSAAEGAEPTPQPKAEENS